MWDQLINVSLEKVNFWETFRTLGLFLLPLCSEMSFFSIDDTTFLAIQKTKKKQVHKKYKE